MSNKFNKYLETWNGKRLLEQYSLDTEGIWQVNGEDPNCDFSGHHYQPDMGVCTGKLVDVIREYVEYSNFWTWGGGGSFRLISIKKITPETSGRTKVLKEEIVQIEARLASLKKELENV